MKKIKINLKETISGRFKIFNFYFTIDLAAVDYAEHIDEFQHFKIDLSNGEIYSIGSQIINNSLGTLKLYTASGYWNVYGDEFELGIDDWGEPVSKGINKTEKEQLTNYFNEHFYFICEEVLALATKGIDLSQYKDSW